MKKSKYDILFEATGKKIEIDHDGKTIVGILDPIYAPGFGFTVKGFSINGIEINLDLISRIKICIA